MARISMSRPTNLKLSSPPPPPYRPKIVDDLDSMICRSKHGVIITSRGREDFCKVLSPLKTQEDLTLLLEVSKHAHLLDLLYHLIVPKLEGPVESCNIYGESEAASFEQNPSLDSSKATQVFDNLWSFVSNLNVSLIKKITTTVKNILGVSGKIISIVPRVSIFASKSKEDIKPENEVSNEETKIPTVEEITIPSVSYLASAGVEFCPTTSGIRTVKFDRITEKFYLPAVITLNIHSEVIMRNSVAYEASITSESLVFT
ncbi:hypothetical protein Vadar_017459 [Vaccinium darrowii]|uniref:Uncharacterized protein n=1 Tax=Vaccinium darrowii TaxID=229202 RepID=A0ACB7YMB9_9ERIC|nr:hypothetical protein Vadar_017459 [Vaccinium darrowii]